MANLTKEQMEAIDNYGSQIKTLKDFVTAVRKRPGMYIGHIGQKGVINMHREIYSNSLDQILAKDSPANWFSYYYNELTTEVRIEDNGKSLPFDDIIRIFTANHTSKNFEKKLYDYSSGVHGSGSKIVNALSTVYTIEAYHYDGTAVRMEFEKGYPKTKAPVKIPNKEKKQGLMTYFIPDTEIMGEDIHIPWKTMYKKIKEVIQLTPIGSTCEFTAVDMNGRVFTETIINKDGIVSDLIIKVDNPINKPIVISNDDGTHKLDIAFCYDAGGDQGPSDNESITAFANFSPCAPTVDSTHVEGALDAITRWFSMYMNNIYLANQKAKDKLKVNSSDIKTGLNICISGAHIDPILTGQSKEFLSNEDMVGFCKETVMRGLDEWSKSNPQDLQKLAKFFKDIAELRTKQEAGKVKIVTKYQKNTLTNLPLKYKPAVNKKGIELIIVEGDSALARAETDRDRYTQALFPIRGKIINAFKCNKQAFFSNEEVQGIQQILFHEDYRKGLTVEDCKVDKVIFLCDADFDGFHICALLERMFVMYYPFLLEAGMIYKAVPPLYSIKDDKKRKYFVDNLDYIKYIQKTFLSQNELKDTKKQSLSNKEVTQFFYKNTDYIYYLEKLANTYALDTYLLEMTLIHYINNKCSFKYDKLKKEITSAYRFMNVYEENGTMIIRGTIDKSNLIILSDKFLSDCKDVLRIMQDNDSLYYILNGKKVTIYTIMKAYEATTPPGRQRYKGLGEMNKDELGESALRPNSDRTLVRYTLDSAKEALNFIREYESNPRKILSEVGQINREDLMD